MRSLFRRAFKYTVGGKKSLIRLSFQQIGSDKSMKSSGLFVFEVECFGLTNPRGLLDHLTTRKLLMGQSSFQLSLSSFPLPDSDHVDKKTCERSHYPDEQQCHNQVERRHFRQQHRCKTHYWKPKKRDRTDCKDNICLGLGSSITPS